MWSAFLVLTGDLKNLNFWISPEISKAEKLPQKLKTIFKFSLNSHVPRYTLYIHQIQIFMSLVRASRGPCKTIDKFMFNFIIRCYAYLLCSLIHLLLLVHSMQRTKEYLLQI